MTDDDTPDPDLQRIVEDMAPAEESSVPFKETIAFHAYGTNSDEFEASLGQAVELASDDGYEVAGISHAADVYGGNYDAVLYSAVVWGQRGVTDDE